MTDQTIFLAALDIPEPAKRAAYLTEACAGNDGLRRQVESLLAAHDRSGEFLDEPAVEQMGRRPTADTVTADSTGAVPPDHSLAYLQPPTRSGSLGRLAHYEVLEVLGRGGFGTVLRAFDDRLHRVVAIKVLAPQLAASGTARARFEREARAAAAVRDEHVVSVHAVTDSTEPVPYLVMEFVGGQTLQQKLDRTGPLSVPEVLRIGTQTARGLAAAHATGLVHRDIKPSNILLENGVERVKITDFGLARAVDDASISHSGLVAGTPMYMAPEQARGEKVDHRADLFSLGSVLYAMCTGRPPFRASTTMGVLKRVAEDAARPVREVNPEVPEWLAAVIAKLHAKDPAARFRSAKDVADLLAKYLSAVQSTGTVTVAEVRRESARREPGGAHAAPHTLDPGTRRKLRAMSWATGSIMFVGTLAIVFLLFTVNPPARGTLFLLDRDPEVEVTIRQGDRILHERSTREKFVLPAHDDTKVIFYRAGNDTEVFRKDVAIQRNEMTFMYFRRELAIIEEQNRARVRSNLAEVGKALHQTQTNGLAPYIEPAPAADGWKPLFNGKDLTGWKPYPTAPLQWKVEGGALVGRGPVSRLLCDVTSTHPFHLRAEARVNDGGVGAVIVHAGPEVLGAGLPHGASAMINSTGAHAHTTSPAANITGPNVYKTGALYAVYPGWTRAPGTDRPPPKPDEWFTLDVLSHPNWKIEVKVNGQTTARIQADAWLKSYPYLALEVTGDKSVIQFRKIEVRTLPATDQDRKPGKQ